MLIPPARPPVALQRLEMQHPSSAGAGPPPVSVKGLSMLRAAEEAKKPKEVSEKAKALQAYLAAQYGDGGGGGGGARGRAAGPRTLDESEEEDGACPLPCGAAAASLAPFSRCCLCCG